MIELTRDQQPELAANEPVAVDPVTKEKYVLVRLKVYERLKSLLSEGSSGEETVAGLPWEIPPGVRRSREAYWRDLPRLWANPRYRRQWVAYHGSKRIGISRSEATLYQKCRKRGLKPDEFFVGMVVQRLPEPETVDPPGGEYTEFPS